MRPRRTVLAPTVGLLILAIASCGESMPGGSAPDAGAPAGVPDGSAPDGGVQPDGGPTVVSCGAPTPPATDGACDVRAGDGAAVLLRGTVLGRDVVYESGAVLYDGSAIVCVGCDCDSPAEAAGATRVDCADAVISPGLNNPHDHMAYTEGEPFDHGETRYDHRHGWRGSLPVPTNPHGTREGSAGTRWGEVRMLLSGVTTMAGAGGATGLIRNLDALSDADRALGLRGVRIETFPLDDGDEQYRAECAWNYVVEEQPASRLHGFLLHVAEGIDAYAAEEFRCQSTSFGGGHDFTERNASHVHSIGLGTGEYAAMVRDGTRLIWSPRSNIGLYGHTAQVAAFDRMGGVVALGTDWTFSGSANMLRELACADQYNRERLAGSFTDEELWRMATWNAAVATGNESVVGSLEAGKVADLAIYAGGPGRWHRAVLEAENVDLLLVVMAGQPVYGEPDVVAGLGQDCEAIDVCGEARALCLSREFGVSYADLAAAVGAGDPAYPAIFCGLPPGEPTCVPSRPGEFSGRAADGDGDGDGIEDASDNCPAFFNPVRPIDGGAQADADGDGEGDACDPTPIGDDLDEDGAGNETDNCPFDPNPDQADADRDTKGDACDFCPDEPNPTSVCP